MVRRRRWRRWGEGADLNSDWRRRGGPAVVKLDLTLN